MLDFPTSANPTSENPTQINKDISSNDKSNTDFINYPFHSFPPPPHRGEAAEPPEQKQRETATQSKVKSSWEQKQISVVFAVESTGKVW